VTSPRPISRLLVANRGEIAVRIIKACRELGIESVAVVSEADKQSLAAKMADRSVCIGPAPSSKSYLQIGTLIEAAKGCAADAIHPGYGFLAERADFSEACEANDIRFVGPRPAHVRTMGDKLQARSFAERLGVPLIPGSLQIHTLEEAASVAKDIGYPVLFKATAGGGGRGMKVAYEPSELPQVFVEASGEARAAFGDDRLFLERFLVNARHIEIQIIGDTHGHHVHLFERDCSTQRRYQKLVEESPSPAIDESLRRQMCDAALDLVRELNYLGVGTIEFAFDQDKREFFFLEMNTRIQVEHPVTEMVTGVDLVAEQLRVAAGYPLSFSQQDIRCSGHAIECRINAELPEKGFRPSPGRITSWRPPSGFGVRVDSHCFSGSMVPPYYDSLLAKLIVRGQNREEAIARMVLALDDFCIEGVDTTLSFCRYLMTHPDFKRGANCTRWVENVVMGDYHGQS